MHTAQSLFFTSQVIPAPMLTVHLATVEPAPVLTELLQPAPVLKVLVQPTLVLTVLVQPALALPVPVLLALLVQPAQVLVVQFTVQMTLYSMVEVV